MEVFDNVNKRVYEDFKKEIEEKTLISMASAYFSMYAYEELKEELEKLKEFRFIFTKPTFIEEMAEKKSREFYIPRLSREKGLYGTDFEVKLRNELTQKSIAKECADWISRKAVFKSNRTKGSMGGFLTLENSKNQYSYAPMQGFTLADIGREKGNNIYNIVQKTESPMSDIYLKMFEEVWNDEEKLEDVTEEVMANISAAYQENSPDLIYFFILYNIFNEFLEDLSEDNLPNELTGFKDSKIWSMLYNFQEDATLAIINKLEEYNGCILADSVGLGKTFTALAVIKYYENRNKSVLVLCPKKLAENWNTYKGNYVNNILYEDRLRYDVLFHTDLSRETGESNGIDLERINWGNYDLVVIDESHNFRNGGQIYGDGNDKRENRYLRLLNKVIRQGVKTKVLMLSATPVNNKFLDLRNQLALSYEGESRKLQEKLKMEKTIDDVFKSAQRAFNVWADFEPANRTTKKLLSMLDFDFFKILDNVTIARSRKHIERYYDTKEIGSFPERLKPISIRESLTDLKGAVNYNDIYDILTSLNLTIYTPSLYILPSRLDKYENRTGIKGENLTQSGREKGIQKLMSINLLKRLESSVHSFKLTLLKIKDYIDSTIEIIENFEGHASLDLSEIQSGDSFDFDDQNTDYFTVGRKIQIDLEDMDYMSWYRELKKDAEYLELLASMIEDIEPKYDNKLKKLIKMIDPPYNTGNDFVYEDDFAQNMEDYKEVSGDFDEEGNRLFKNTDSNGRFHTDWLNMMYPRLKLARDLLSDDGVIFISIDDNEVDNLRKICNEIFGETNYIGELIRKTKSMTGDSGVGFNLQHESLQVYAKNKVKASLKGEEKDFKNYTNPDNDKNGDWCSGDPSAKSGSSTTFFPIINPITGKEDYPPKGRYWAFSKSTLTQYIETGKIKFKDVYTTNERGFIFKRYKRDLMSLYNPVNSLFAVNNKYMNQEATLELTRLFNESLFTYPKPTNYVEKIIKYSTNKDSVILDFFSGSATTAHAVMELNAEDNGNRKYIMVQLPEETEEKSEAYKAGYKNICEIGKERIRRAGRKIKEDHPDSKFDDGFRVLRVDSSNIKDVYHKPEDYSQSFLDKMESNIKEDRNEEDLLFQVMLSLGIDLSSKIEKEKINENKVLIVEDGFLISCFDEEIFEETVESIAKKQPYYAVFSEGKMSDSTLANFEQIFDTYSPTTIRKVI